MTGIAASRMRGGPSPAALPHDTLTHVELTWVEKKIENWIRFGMHAHEQILDRRRRVLSFRPGTIFAFVRWASNDFGTIISRIDIVHTVSRGEAYQTLPFVRPGGDILLKVESWPKVERVLQAIDGIERLGIGLRQQYSVDAGVRGTNHAHNELEQWIVDFHLLL